jgi:hypothetical protein
VSFAACIFVYISPFKHETLLLQPAVDRQLVAAYACLLPSVAFVE